jgi:hypothetical protein
MPQQSEMSSPSFRDEHRREAFPDDSQVVFSLEAEVTNLRVGLYRIELWESMRKMFGRVRE